MSLQGIFDPVVKAYFKNKYGGENGFDEGYKEGYAAGVAEPPTQKEAVNVVRSWRASILNNMFAYCYNITELDLSEMNTQGVTNMSSMFMYCTDLTSLNMSNCDTSNVTNMNSMFAYCRKLPRLDLSSFDTKSVTNMGSMFSNCDKLTELVLGERFVFGASISFQQSPLSDSSVDSIIAHLKDLTGATAQTLTLNADVGAKLTEAQKADITAKNWTLVF